MFGFFKTADELEMDLRNWAYDEHARVVGNDDAYDFREYIYKREIRELAEDVASSAVTRIEQNKMFQKMAGIQPKIGEHLFYVKGLSLVQKLGRKKKWKLFQKGSPALGYRCEIIEAP